MHLGSQLAAAALVLRIDTLLMRCGNLQRLLRCVMLLQRCKSWWMKLRTLVSLRGIYFKQLHQARFQQCVMHDGGWLQNAGFMMAEFNSQRVSGTVQVRKWFGCHVQVCSMCAAMIGYFCSYRFDTGH
jgi:hypothetical protein